MSNYAVKRTVHLFELRIIPHYVELWSQAIHPYLIRRIDSVVNVNRVWVYRNHKQNIQIKTKVHKDRITGMLSAYAHG